MARRPAGCPCGLRQFYAACCGRFHGGRPAPTAELLMRSRFSAFAMGDPGYLLRTWDVSTRPEVLELDALTVWKRLTVLSATDDTVSFEARYVHDGRPGKLCENSSFQRVDGEWFYLGSLD